MSRQYFTVEQANAMLPELKSALVVLYQLHLHIKSTFSELDDLGFAPDSDQFEVEIEDAESHVLQRRAALRGLIDAMRIELEELHQRGCIVKDIDTGTVGWYATHPDEGDIFLSWQMGEPEVGHWHPLQGGDIRRRPLRELGAAVEPRRS